MTFNATLIPCAIGKALDTTFVAAFPVNSWPIGRGRGHAVVQQHGHDGH